MRSNLIGMCSAVAAVAVAGSANASLVFDNFQSAQNVVATAAQQTNYSFNFAYAAPSPAFSGSRFLTANGYWAGPPEQASQVNVGGGTATLEVGGSGNFTSFLTYAPATAADLTNFVFTVTVSSATGTGATLEMSLSNGGTVARALTGAGTYSFAVSEFSGPSFNPASVSSILLVLRTGLASAGATNASATLTSFNYSIIPAPGAVALLGAAGLVGMRRRKA
ncbi:MAG: hypothetical protein RLZZ558_479 [Planctomycetota bacterium]